MLRRLLGRDRPDGVTLLDYVHQIDRFNASQSNCQLLDSIRQYNHYCVDSLDEQFRLSGKRLLEIGASPHGYSLERALHKRVAEFVGIGLDIDHPLTVKDRHSVGKLLHMNAERLDFETSAFDAVLSLSTFEHILNVRQALSEIRRVLRPGGVALVTFEPVWTCSYGHHLHHFGPVSRYMPDWAHLLWTKDQMLRNLSQVWPPEASPTLAEAAAWVYDSTALNRIGIGALRELFRDSDLHVEWMESLPDQDRDSDRLRAVSERLHIPSEDLMVKGLSVFMRKQVDAWTPWES
jgi:SAM-dependent methyltransferase